MTLARKFVKHVMSHTDYSILRTDKIRQMSEKFYGLDGRSFLERHFYRYSHHPASGMPNFSADSLKETTTEVGDIEIAERLLRYYKYVTSEPEYAAHAGHMWQDHEGTDHKFFLSCLEDGDSRALAGHLQNMSVRDVTQGLTQGAGYAEALRGNSYIQTSLAYYIFDRLICLAEALGCVPLENPEQGRWDKNIYLTPAEVVKAIESELGFEIMPPQVEHGLFGLEIGGRVIGPRDIYSLHAAYRISRVLRRRTSASVCEIGAGLGKVAYWANRFGLRDYTIFDLPYVSVLSAYFLLKSLPSSAVVLHGEPGADTKGTIKIFPFWHLERMPKRHFDLVLNQDSMPEIEQTIVQDYLKTIKKVCSKYFLSINQEGQAPLTAAGKPQLRVMELARKEPGYEEVYRQKFWTREGYVEELFDISEKEFKP